MAEQQLNGAQVSAGFEQVDGKGMAQRVRGDRLGDASPAPRLFTGVLHGEGRDRLIGDVAGEQEILRVDGVPISPENVQQPRREHHVAILPPLALLHADDHPLAIDRRWRQADRFGDTQAGRVADGQDGAMLPAVDGVEEPGDLVLAEHDRKLLRFATGGNDLVDAPTPSERNLVEKADGGHRDQYRTGRESLLLAEMELIGPNISRPQDVG